MGLDNLKNGITGILESAVTLLRNPVVAGGVGAAAGLGVGALVGAKLAKKKRKKKSKTRNTRKRSHRVKHKRKRKGRRTPQTAGKRKDTSRKRIRYTKKGQPYIIQSNGRARFIKKSSAKTRHKRKGGYY